MINLEINRNIFKVKYLQDFARWILNNKLDEFVLVNIRFCREAQLPILKPLGKFTEEKLVALSIETNRYSLNAIADNKIAELIEGNSKKWLENAFGYIDRDEIAAEDITIGFHLRRKTYAYFLEGYTQNVVLQKQIMEELDVYTTQEELITYTIYLHLQKEKLSKTYQELQVQKQMLIETQELAGVGSFVIDFLNPNNSIFTDHYKKIFGFEGKVEYDQFLKYVHADDVALFRKQVERIQSKGGDMELEYRYNGPSGQKKQLWFKGRLELKNGKRVSFKGTVRDVTEKHAFIEALQRSEAALIKAQGMNQLGNWTWTLETGDVTWSPEMYNIFEVDADFKPTLAKFIEFIHPDDIELVKTHLQKLEAAPSTTEYKYRIITAKNNAKIIRGISEVQTNAAKVIVRCFGTCQDVSGSVHVAGSSEEAALTGNT